VLQQNIEQMLAVEVPVQSVECLPTIFASHARNGCVINSCLQIVQQIIIVLMMTQGTLKSLLMMGSSVGHQRLFAVFFLVGTRRIRLP
jgi:hypothetical protein